MIGSKKKINIIFYFNINCEKVNILNLFNRKIYGNYLNLNFFLFYKNFLNKFLIFRKLFF